MPEPPAIFEAARRYSLEAASLYSRPLLWEALLKTFLWTGLRHTEVTHLKWSDIKGDTIILVQEGGDERTVFLAEPVLEVLERWKKEAPPTTWVFPSAMRPDEPVCAATVIRAVRRFGREAGLDGLHPHRFRHTCATALLEQTGDVTIVQKALGHASLDSTMIYAAVQTDNVRNAVRRLSYDVDLSKTAVRQANASVDDLLAQIDRELSDLRAS